MRYVDHDEQVQLVAAALRRVPANTIKQLDHYDAEKRLRARVSTAAVIVEAMQRLEILTSAPDGPAVNYQAISGLSGIPPQRED